MTKYIEEFLTHFDDQHLANLQCAAEDGTLLYNCQHGCLVHHHQGDYYATRFSLIGLLAAAAEDEFLHMADSAGPYVPADPQGPRESQRRRLILPLIHAEWARRARPVPVTFEQPAKIEVAICRDQTS